MELHYMLGVTSHGLPVCERDTVTVVLASSDGGVTW